MTPSVFTVGHSTRSIDAFAAILRQAGVTRIADVRAFPASKRHPQFNSSALAAALEDAGIDYHQLPALGGRRTAKKSGASRNGLWKVEAFRNYADYAETPAFAEALDALEALARERPTAFMCAEAVWWQCHRRLIADYMLARGWMVIHLLAPGKRQDAILTPGAVVERDGTIAYPPSQPGLLP
ncbi:MAG TPA: DUF488 domain-containing protein [Vicinamibacterales bacterium]